MEPQRVALVVGASRGIGRQVAVDLARNGYAAKSTSDASATHPFPPDPNSPQSTINTVEREIREGGGTATAMAVDVRDPESVQRLVDSVVKIYNRLDVLVYNSGAIWWASVEDTPLKRFQLMQRVNPEGLYATVQASLPHLKKSVGSSSSSSTAAAGGGSGRIIVVSPPIYSRFFRGKTAYAMGKVGMSVLTKGLAMDLERQGLADRMAITSIWPAVAIESGATRALLQSTPSEAKDLRKPTIFSDAILAMLRAPAAVVNGRLELDEDFLRTPEGGAVTDFDKYALVPRPEGYQANDAEWVPPRRIMPNALPDLRVAEQDDEGRLK
ncbi:putative Hydroxysteroid dehydrogenase-like protein 2 [Microdochium bolleyi]|uniref:Putative Hydroxysteroid dehydrogenase-like protein 2 n=1 Tax=Microdochium bolleyi TaxID=196109 RepID=A0A136JCD2_9PEZI|nr:putative Hydroxysteroid dehydrogenase-like protein 2 [Microdochium bolleyi]